MDNAIKSDTAMLLADQLMADTTTRNIFNATPSTSGYDGFGLGGAGMGSLCGAQHSLPNNKNG